MRINHTNIYRIGSYSEHLKNLDDSDRYSRFGYKSTNQNIDQFILSMCYHPDEHELWYCEIDDVRVGWGHLAKNTDDSWELAVSVDSSYRHRGIGNALITEMLSWAKFNRVDEVFMHCITGNKTIQHLAIKNNLKIRHRDSGEITSVIEVPPPTLSEVSDQLWKEQSEIISNISKLQSKLGQNWIKPILPK
jgi:GNAT superfamily N-acetyltransferase